MSSITITRFGSIARSNIRYKTDLSSIRYIKKILINIANFMVEENDAVIEAMVDKHIATEGFFHVLTAPEHKRQSLIFALEDIHTDLSNRGLYSGDINSIIGALVSSMILYVDPSSPSTSLFDTVGFKKAFARMLEENHHTTLEILFDERFSQLPRSVISYSRGHYANYSLIDPQIIEAHETYELNWIASRQSPGDYIDFVSHEDNALDTVPTKRGWREVIDMSMYGESNQCEVWRKKLNYYTDYNLFDIRDNPTPEQQAHTTRLRKSSGYSKVHNLMGFGNSSGVLFDIDLRAAAGKTVDLFNFVGRSKSQAALVIDNNELRVEADCFDVTKSTSVIADLGDVETLSGYFSFNNGQIKFSYIKDGEIVTQSIPQSNRSYWESVFYLFIGPIVDTYKRDCIRLGYVELFAIELKDVQVEALLRQRGEIYG